MRADARSLAIPVVEPSQVGEARRAAALFAERAGLNETAAGKLGVIATELGNNLQKHARDGVITVRAAVGEPCVEIMAIDRGPGMSDVDKCLRDGFSTAGTAGQGLGAITRMASEWDIYSTLGAGTILMANIADKSTRAAGPRLDVGAVCLPMKGETHCGDNWARMPSGGCERIMVADGLGHGPSAAEASDEAEAVFRARPGTALIELMQALHNALKKTRGAAVAIADLDFEKRVVRYVGVGNISTTILAGGQTRSLVSQNGTVGHETRKIQEYQYPWPEGSLLVMNSDGLLSRWELTKYPGLVMRRSSVIAAALWRDFTRGRDDATVVVAREKTRA